MKLRVLIAALALALFPAGPPVAAQSTPSSLAIAAGGYDGVEVAIPYGQSAGIRVEGRDLFGRRVSLDPAKVVWETRSRSFDYAAKGDVMTVTPLLDAFGLDGSRGVNYDPGGMIRVRYGDKSLTFKVGAVLNLKGKWLLEVTGDKIILDLKQSGRSVWDEHGRKGVVTGKVLKLEMTHYWRGIPIPLWPAVTFTSRTAGTGTVVVPDANGSKTETFTVTKQP